MLTKLKIIMSLILIGIVFSLCKNHFTNEKFSFNKIYHYAIQEDVSKIIAALNSMPDDSLSADQSDIKERYIARFQTKTEKFVFQTQDSLIISILSIFQNYWSDVLMKKKSLKASEDENAILITNLIQSYAKEIEGITDYNADVKDIPLGSLLNHYGYYSRIDRTGNILDLIVWTKQTKDNYTVNLADTTVNVPVVFIDSTVTLGWEGYATFDHFYPGGWTGADTLFCVRKDYDLSSEHFKINFLTHETQHIVDSKVYSGCSGWLAEYRAKLAELSVAEKTVYERIVFFIKGSKKDSRLTHPYAEYLVIRDLSKEIFNKKFVTDTKKWEAITYKEINSVSRKLLQQNSVTLTKK